MEKTGMREMGMKGSTGNALELALRRRRLRIATLMAHVDAGEPGALEELERRVTGDRELLAGQGKQGLAGALRAWHEARCEDVRRAGEYASREDLPGTPAPARWLGLRVRVSYIARGGGERPSELAGRLVDVTERGICVQVDEIEEERDGKPEHLAGSIVRRVTSERLVCWPALLSMMPLPIRARGEENA